MAATAVSELIPGNQLIYAAAATVAKSTTFQTIKKKTKTKPLLFYRYYHAFVYDVRISFFQYSVFAKICIIILRNILTE